MVSRLEANLNKALENTEKARNIIIKKLEKETDPRRKLYLRDYKIELFDIQLRLKDMQRNLPNIEGDKK